MAYGQTWAEGYLIPTAEEQTHGDQRVWLIIVAFDWLFARLDWLSKVVRRSHLNGVQMGVVQWAHELKRVVELEHQYELPW